MRSQKSKKHLHLKHNIQSDIVCPKCKKVFGQKNMLLKHIPTCGHKLKGFICPVKGCGKGFRSKYTLENHRVNMHPEADEEPPKFICEFCFVHLPISNCPLCSQERQTL